MTAALSDDVNVGLGDGSVRFIAQGISPQTWREAHSPSGGEVLGTDYATVTSVMGDWEDDWFEDYEEGDELDEDVDEDMSPAARLSVDFIPWAQAHDKFT